MPSPHVSRSYDANPEACSSAVAILLRSIGKKKKGDPTTSRPQDAKGLRHDRATEIVQEKRSTAPVAD
jgi:hypothetical protein